MSEPDENDDLPFTRSSIAAIGARRRWRLFGKDEEPGVASGPADTDDEPVSRSMLGSLAGRSGPEPRAEPAGPRSLLSLEGAAEAAPEGDEETVLAPLTAHSTLGELAGLEEHAGGGLPIERGVLISLFVHLLLVVLLITVPAHVPTDPKKGLLAAFVPEERDTSPIPVIFQESIGPPRENPKRSPLSDADRRASGGDRSRPKAESPFVPPSPGIAGLAPGPRSRRAPAREAARPGAGAGAQAESRAALEPSKSQEQKPSEFPSDMRPQLGSGPREISKLAGLDRAIQEAARSAVGGEGGGNVPNENGGFVDFGGVSFESSWYDWGPYAAEMLRRIKLHWDISRDLAILQQHSNVVISFSIMADGSVVDAKVHQPSHIPPYTYAALQAILTSNPFRPLPKDLLRLVPGKDRERIMINFMYFPTDEELNDRRRAQ